MSFPPHDVIQSEVMFYRLMDVADSVNAAIADTGLTAELGHTPQLTQYLKVALTQGGAVVLAPRQRYPGAWHLVWPSSSEPVERVWPLDVEEDVLAKIVASAVSNALEGHPMPSPFCWGHIERGPLTALADRMAALGVSHEAIDLEPLRYLDEDRQPRSSFRGRRELRITDQSDPDRRLVIAHHGACGWSVDQVMPFVGASGRLDLAAALGLRPQLPRVEADEVNVDRLALLLAEDTFWVDVPDDGQRHLARYGQTPDECRVSDEDSLRQAASAWLVWAGFGDRAARRVDPLALSPAIELYVNAGERQLGISDVQRIKGVASVGGRTPVVAAWSGFSRNAREWADEAKMILFLTDHHGNLYPASHLAAVHTPVHMGDRPSVCDDRTCRQIACVLEDEFCPSHSGRSSHPDASRWRLSRF